MDGHWGTVCDNGWGYNDARVVCRQLGFPTVGEIEFTILENCGSYKILKSTGTVGRKNAYYGRGSGYIMLTYVECNGEEQSLLNCTHIGDRVTSCSHSQDAGVSCPGNISIPYMHDYIINTAVVSKKKLISLVFSLTVKS